ncbi:MAG: hypothetical protein IKL29_05465 [Bacteroidaceae bacterium]|nr:hypothetical protein [Bacteroidaceae bacterium]
MIAVLKNGVTKAQRDNLVKWLESQNVRVHISEGEMQTVLGLIGDTSKVDIDLLSGLDIISNVTRISEPFKSANRRFHPDDTVIEVGQGENAVKIGGGNFCIMAGPCSVESEEQILAVAHAVKASGANMLRGGAFKPRTSPYDFQGLRAEGLQLLIKAREATGLPFVTEIMSAAHLDLFADVDIIQVGARNMQNFELLKELGRSNKPILLKRGMSATLKELLMSAEYIMSRVMKMSFCVNEEYAATTAIHVTFSTLQQYLYLKVLHIYLLLSTPATQQGYHALCVLWLVQQQHQEPMVLLLKYTTTLFTLFAMEHNHSHPSNLPMSHSV